MYTLFSGFYKYMTQKEEYYVVILGLDNAGKTTLLERIKSIFLGTPGLPPDKIAPTVGLNIGKILIESSRINFWDLGGQRDLQSLWEKYYKECHAIMFVVDSTDVERMEDVVQVFEKIIQNDDIVSVPIIVLANKQDLPNALGIHEIKELFNRVAAKMSARESNTMSVSALQGLGVKEAVEWLYFRMERNKESRPPLLKD